MVDKLIYNTVLAQTFSPCGNYLLVGNTYGEIAVYDLQYILSPGDEFTPPLRTPRYHFTPKEDVQICSMITTEDFLVIGTIGEIFGYDWKTITKSQKPQIAWTIIIPTSKDAMEKPDVNSMVLKQEDNHVLAGCGDNKVYYYDLDEGSLVRTFEGHKDFVHCVHSLGSNVVSASEDGTVKLWDLRRKDEVQTISPHLKSELSRPSLGKWLGAASISEDWLVCGGGPCLSLWHLRSMTMAEAFLSLNDNGIYIASLYEDRVLAGGASPYLSHLSLSGSLLAQVPSSSTCLYSVVLQEKPHKVLCMAGSSSKIDLCTNFSYRDQILTFGKSGANQEEL